jgi:hypothetical protein
MAAMIPDGKSRISIFEPTAANSSRARNLYSRMKLIPWREIRESMFTARIRGHAETTDLLVNSIVEDALLDDPEVLSRMEANLLNR